MDPARAALAFRDRLRMTAERRPFMKGKTKLVGVEFAEMAEVLFPPAPVEGRVFTLQDLKGRLQEIMASGTKGFQALKKTTDIDRALPRLVAAAHLTEAFGYTRLELTERELGSGLIIEAGMKKR